MKRIYILGRFITFLCVAFSSTAQPAYIYEGGEGGGYSSISYNNINAYFFEGGNSDGFSTMNLGLVNVYFYEGGDADGFSSMNSSTIDVYFYHGGSSDGFSSFTSGELNVYLLQGGNNGGYAENQVDYSGTTFLEGDIGQGYDLATKCEDFIWTGVLGTGWSVAGNWNYNTVPNGSRPVIIPAGAPNYPNVNAGILAIGDNPNSGAFECKSIWIQDGGELITRINNFVENYGMILIDGSMLVKNSAPNAIQNLANGTIRISPTGILYIKP